MIKWNGNGRRVYQTPVGSKNNNDDNGDYNNDNNNDVDDTNGVLLLCGRDTGNSFLNLLLKFQGT